MRISKIAAILFILLSATTVFADEDPEAVKARHARARAMQQQAAEIQDMEIAEEQLQQKQQQQLHQYQQARQQQLLQLQQLQQQQRQADLNAQQEKEKSWHKPSREENLLQDIKRKLSDKEFGL
jgi:hypothetical protein